MYKNAKYKLGFSIKLGIWPPFVFRLSVWSVIFGGSASALSGGGFYLSGMLQSYESSVISRQHNIRPAGNLSSTADESCRRAIDCARDKINYPLRFRR